MKDTREMNLEKLLEQFTIKNIMQKDKEEGVWPTLIEKQFGGISAWSFSYGTDLLLEQINDFLKRYKDNRSITIRQANEEEGMSYSLDDLLPDVYQDKYNADFLETMRDTITHLQKRASGKEELSPHGFQAHTPLEELVIYMSVQGCEDMFDVSIDELREANLFFDWYDIVLLDMMVDSDMDDALEAKERFLERADEDRCDTWSEWIFDPLFGDADVELFLYDKTGIKAMQESGNYPLDDAEKMRAIGLNPGYEDVLGEAYPYGFENWTEHMFY